MQSTPYQLINNAESWSSCLDRVRASNRIALDIEANSLYVYREHLCLIQLSIHGQDYIIDPLAGFDLGQLGKILADANVEKVFHASEYDLILFKREFGWQAVNLFDTMWAARILGYTNMGLAWFLREFYEVTLSKKYQKTDWARRPLSHEQLEYAYKDTHYLLQLRDDLAVKLEAAGLMEEAREIFAREADVRVPERLFDPDGFWRLRGVRELPPQAQAIVAALYLFREEEAKRRNLPPFKIFTNDVIIVVARHAPRSLKELNAVPSIPGAVKRHYAAEMLRLVAESSQGPAPHPPRRSNRVSAAVLDRYDKLQRWRKETAQQRGVESDVILTRETMWALAQTRPTTLEELAQIPTLGPHRLALYGALILEELA
ncbi:MAG: HRDC domain-containing protein [Candidatus Hydrogenedentes bacterium]|nr:HRDC domain-containing protein [Candidatus Hydrogenedentota bacterium]MBI3118002.1 HRDC domain-containing protein [Candidatus Hydrogenedentota bacterium]